MYFRKLGVKDEGLEMEEGQPTPNEEEEEGEEEEDGEDNIEELYDMEHYDSEGEEGNVSLCANVLITHCFVCSYHLLVCFCLGEKVSGAGMGSNMAGLTYYPSDVNDPYITLKNMVRPYHPCILLVLCGNGH